MTSKHVWIEKDTHCIYKRHWFCIRCRQKAYQLIKPKEEGCSGRK